jgi:hypothetical protein
MHITMQDTLAGRDSDVAALHGVIRTDTDVASRMYTLAQALIGCPYLANSLGGGPDKPETLTINLRAFDCVTLVECVLALARSRSQGRFVQELQHTRYRHGRVTWASRLHYFSEWMTHNHQRGAVRIRTPGKGSRVVQAKLGVIPELPTRHVQFHVVPKQRIEQVHRRITHGSIVAFASVRAKLDFFHTGLIFVNAAERQPKDSLTLVHASKTAGQVIQEPLGEFLQRNRMRGVAFAEPRGVGDSA